MFAPADKPKTGSQIWSLGNWLWIAISILAGVRLHDHWQARHFVGVAVYSACFFQIPAVILHELGHAFAAVSIGTKVLRIKLGLTPSPTGPHASFRFIGFPWEVYALPLSGSVHYIHPTEPELFRRRTFWVTACGPLASLLAAVIGYALYRLNPSALSSALYVGWCEINIILVVFTLIPFNVTSRGKKLACDGLNLWRYATMSNDVVRERCFQAQIQTELNRDAETLNRLSLDELSTYCDSHPERVGALLRLIDRLVAAKDARQNKYIEKFLALPEFRPATFATFLDNHLTRHLDQGTIGNNPHFDQFSQKLLDVSGQSITARGTRGSVLIDLGRVDEGKAMLLDVLAKTSSAVDKSYANIFLALAEKHAGNLEGAGKHATVAAVIAPKCPALKRVADMVDTAELRRRQQRRRLT